MSSLKLNPKSGLYSLSNVYYNPKTKKAVSYNWWTFVKVINGQLFFNSYNYSNTTVKHQHKVRNLLNQLGIKVDVFVATSLSLDDSRWIADAIERYQAEIAELQDAIARPRSQRAKNKERETLIGIKQTKIDFLKTLKIKAA